MTINKYQKPSLQTQDEALKISKGTQRPAQTKEQTKLIAQGIQKGIDLYKKSWPQLFKQTLSIYK